VLDVINQDDVHAAIDDLLNEASGDVHTIRIDLIIQSVWTAIRRQDHVRPINIDIFFKSWRLQGGESMQLIRCVVFEMQIQARAKHLQGCLALSKKPRTIIKKCELDIQRFQIDELFLDSSSKSKELPAMIG
jgi:hypothetical protein